MEYGINIEYFTPNVSMERAAEAVAKAGFTMLDYTPPVEEDNWEEIMKNNFKIFRENGLSVHQTHAPFNRYGRYRSRHQLCMDRCMEATAYMGAKYVAVHGDEFDFENLTFSREKALDYNYNYFRFYVEQAKKTGCKIAFETVFEDMPRKRRYTSEPEELLALITSFQSENAVCCWDFGHANVAFSDRAAEYLTRFGELVQCTHVHDNTGVDAHSIPLTGDINWKEMSSILHKIGYNGVMSMEYSHGRIPEALLDDFLSLSYKAISYIGDGMLQ